MLISELRANKLTQGIYKFDKSYSVFEIIQEFLKNKYSRDFVYSIKNKRDCIELKFNRCIYSYL